ESKKSNKSKKEDMPSSIKAFVEAKNNPNTIEVLLINQGMLNSNTINKSYDKALFDKFSIPSKALASVNPFVIIDEPHRFKKDKKTWKNIQKLKPQIILRFGATFTEYENLIYTLTAVDAFNQNLVKGVIGYVEKNNSVKNALIELINLDGKEAVFKIIDGKTSKTISLVKKESLGKLHPEIDDIFIEKMNKLEVVLSNGLSLRKKEKINPYAFSKTLEEIMIKNTIKNHFEIEKELLDDRTLFGKPKIKPLTLFFIDNIDEYRNKDGKLRKIVEEAIIHYTKEALKNAKSNFYKEYLKKSLQNISQTHGGYFSKDNYEKDESIENEINEILHDKEKLLSLENPRKFIFSKWTLKEGWDNPNIFQICKLRSSGSEISKLQEVGRGLRLPVNEYMAREKSEFYLHYFVDFTEEDFVDRLVSEINEKSNLLIEKEPKKVDEDILKRISFIYNKKEDELVNELGNKGIIDFSKKFINDGYKKLKELYPKAFTKELRKGKIKKAEKERKKVKVRVGKYKELKDLWEKINEKVILEYKVKEEEFEDLLYNFFKEENNKFTKNSISFESKIIQIDKNKAYSTTKEVKNNTIFKSMSYKNFLIQTATECKINIQTLHNVFVKLKKQNILNINNYLNQNTIRIIKREFDNYLFMNSINKLSIEYKKVGVLLHPTKLTDSNGKPLKEINASDIGVYYSNEKVADRYYFEELFYDSDLEKENIKYNDLRVIVFTKIPKNSIKIPMPGGKSYSPDFACVIKDKDNTEGIYFVVETKDKEEKDLSKEEKIKIEYAKNLFGKNIKILFKQQFKNQKIKDIINELIDNY
ncbi:MAG TPA: type III restriction-modification system endonuclease, partial [Nautiliaceae bacterium]|nr:type III restriction-modification system endonuclease [Nautiliaceae bacterium]